MCDYPSSLLLNWTTRTLNGSGLSSFARLRCSSCNFLSSISASDSYFSTPGYPLTSDYIGSAIVSVSGAARGLSQGSSVSKNVSNEKLSLHLLKSTRA